MPVVHVNLLEDVFSTDEKHEVITKVTDVFASIKGDKFRDVTVVMIHETASGNIGKGGQVLTSEMARSLATA